MGSEKLEVKNHPSYNYLPPFQCSNGPSQVSSVTFPVGMWIGPPTVGTVIAMVEVTAMMMMMVGNDGVYCR